MQEFKNILPTEKEHPKIPCYVMEEEKLRYNLSLIKDVAQRSGAEIILAFKAFALWKSFPIFREYIKSSTASSIFEARMGYEYMGSPTYTFAPAYKEDEFDEILKYSDHIVFNSLSQFQKFYPLVQNYGGTHSCGIRINPEYSTVGTDLYNPCAPGSRLGILSSQLPQELPQGIDGFHFHSHCESNSYDLEETLKHVEEKFGEYLPQLKWLNMGGGHLMTHAEYDVEHLITLLRRFKEKYPNLTLILEPGSAFAWQTGYLKTQVLDVVENSGIKTLIVDASFTAHMPDCLEMPYQPRVRGAEIGAFPEKGYVYRIGGNSCLSGDFIGDWTFPQEVKIGDIVLFEDMIHYTTVKTTMFNGIPHPSIAIKHTDGTFEIYRSYGYEDYLNRMC
ncbi:carboxynorspermidine decarboxylase [Porphyromonas sp. COT-108 OH1349]|uniref:carboxynorspermidine decarboxylase n=1 Tax=Porphyromonas sp. COT-108 OH1349 TaxID=1537504 RepID=UPI00068F8331|nr:carboxynorspermidine decarboxylase [Porphyromonas sp. COT-108 OH1349]